MAEMRFVASSEGSKMEVTYSRVGLNDMIILIARKSELRIWVGLG